MITNRVYRLKEAAELRSGISLPKGQEIEIVTDVVYINGHMVAPEAQTLFYNWIVTNSKLFDDVTKSW